MLWHCLKLTHQSNQRNLKNSFLRRLGVVGHQPDGREIFMIDYILEDPQHHYEINKYF